VPYSLEEFRRGAHIPLVSHEFVGEYTTEVCDAWPVYERSHSFTCYPHVYPLYVYAYMHSQGTRAPVGIRTISGQSESGQ